MIDRSDAVNLARNLKKKDGSLTPTGRQCLVDAVLRMDEYIRRGEADKRDAVLEEAAKVCDEMFASHYGHSQRKNGAIECAVAIRAMKRQSATEGSK